MSNENPNLPTLIGPNTDATTALQIKKSRRADESLMRIAGATDVDVTINRLTSLVNDSDANLMTIRREGETIPDLMARVDADEFSTDNERSLVNASRSSRLSLETEKASKQRMAEEFNNETFENDVSELKTNYETAMKTLVNREMKKWSIDAMSAKALVDEDLRVRGVELVMPIYSRIYARFAARWPTQAEAAERG